MKIIKGKINPVNRIVIGVFIGIGWIASYSAMYYLAYTNGIQHGRAEIIDIMYAKCIAGGNVKFYNDNTEYVCMKVGRM